MSSDVGSQCLSCIIKLFIWDSGLHSDPSSLACPDRYFGTGLQYFDMGAYTAGDICLHGNNGLAMQD